MYLIYIVFNTFLYCR